MRGLRTLISALCIVGGGLLIAWWALASVIVGEVEDGSAVRGMTERALDSPVVMNAITADLTARARAALMEQGVDIRALGLDSQLEGTISQAVETDVFRATVLDQVDEAHGQVTRHLTDAAREPAPLTVSVDLSDSLNARIDELGGFAAAAPDISVPPVTIEALGEEQFERARTAYERTVWAQQWGLWAGLGLLAFGLLVSPRRRWFVPKVLAMVGVACLGLGAVLALLGPDTVTTFMPGGVDGSLATLWREILPPGAATQIMERSLVIGAGSLIAALIATAIAAAMGDRRRSALR